jgi:HSP20 family molecular chaperone IbpA
MNTAPSYRPEADIFENNEEFVLFADVPGATSDKVDVRLDDGVLSLTADAGDRRWTRRFAVPRGIDGEHISAELRQGVLKIVLPKGENARARRIAVAQA